MRINMRDRFTEWFYNTLFDLNFLSTFIDFLWEKIGLFFFIFFILIYVLILGESNLRVKIKDFIKANEDSPLQNDLNEYLDKTVLNFSLGIYCLLLTIFIMFVAYATTFSGAAWLPSLRIHVPI